jgi:hypothetical protein
MERLPSPYLTLAQVACFSICVGFFTGWLAFNGWWG